MKTQLQQDAEKREELQVRGGQLSAVNVFEAGSCMFQLVSGMP